MISNEPTPAEAETGDLYNEYAEDRTVHPRARSTVKAWHRAMARHYESLHGPLAGRDVLEIGHGHGFFGEVATELGARYRAIEMSSALAEAGRRRGMRVEVGRIPPIPPELTESVDVVWMSHVLEHARDWMEARAMAESVRHALRPGGVLVVIVPDYKSWGIEFWNGDWSHGFPTTARRCVQLLRDCGYAGVTSELHQGGRFDLPGRAVAATIARLAPFRAFDAVFSRRGSPDTGFGYSYMTLFGWRQIFLTGKSA